MSRKARWIGEADMCPLAPDPWASKRDRVPAHRGDMGGHRALAGAMFDRHYRRGQGICISISCASASIIIEMRFAAARSALASRIWSAGLSTLVWPE
jgi:hypothetical protein